MYNGRGVLFDARLAVEIRGGTLTAGDRKLTVAGADEAVVRLTAASSYNGFDKDPVAKGSTRPRRQKPRWPPQWPNRLTRFARRTLRDYGALFNRVRSTWGLLPRASRSRPTCGSIGEGGRRRSGAGDARVRTAVRLQGGGMIVSFDLEYDVVPVVEADHAGIVGKHADAPIGIFGRTRRTKRGRESFRRRYLQDDPGSKRLPTPF